MFRYSRGDLPGISFVLLITFPAGKPVQEQHKGDDRQPKRPFFGLILIFLISLALFMAHEDFLSEKDGETTLAPWRKAKMMKELEEMEYGEQYVLKASKPGFYPCFHCQGKDEIFLNYGEIWKYGVTSRSEKGRYRNTLLAQNLFYYPEFEGLLQDCYKREKIQIYYYALLPENLIRKHRLIRPPGNKQDN